MGLRDRYSAWEELTPAEESARLREVADERRTRALERVGPLDLSSTLWPELPHSEVVNAVIHTSRGWAINRYPDRHAEALRRALAERHGVDPTQLVVGNGAAELLDAAAAHVLRPGDELLTPWPSYPLYPLLAARAAARAVPVPGLDPGALAEAARGERVKLLVLCNPNDPTGERLRAAALGDLLARLPEHVTVLVDEALGDYADEEPLDATVRLLDAFPRLVLVRTFSKAWGLAGVRVGYAVAAPQAAELLAAMAPALGVGALAQAAALEALKRHEQIVERRRREAIEGRARIAEALRGLPGDMTPSQANLAWIRADAFDGANLALRLERHGVRVQAGGALGADDHVRALVGPPETVGRLVRALELALGRG
jgi:histidinol-phosphate aminotransferase